MTVTKPSCILQRTTIVINIYRVMKRYVRMSRIMSRAPPICSTNYKSDVSRQMITDIERDVISGRTSRSLSLSLSPRVNSIESRTMRIDEPRIRKYYFSSTPCSWKETSFFFNSSTVCIRSFPKEKKI